VTPGDGLYDVWVHGPNGFLRHATGTAVSSATGIEMTLALTGAGDHPRVRLTLTNPSAQAATLRLVGIGAKGAGQTELTVNVAAHGHATLDLDPLRSYIGWYDFVVALAGHPEYKRRFAGHLENGQPSRTRA
jgi:phospholipase C